MHRLPVFFPLTANGVAALAAGMRQLAPPEKSAKCFGGSLIGLVEIIG
jgi:hypothetical protein